MAHVPEDVGSAGALRAIAHHLSANDIMVKDLFCTCFFSRGLLSATIDLVASTGDQR